MKSFIVLVTVCVTFALLFPIALPEIKAHAISSILEAETISAHYTMLLHNAEAKRDWVEAEMAGEQGLMQTQALRTEVNGLKPICNRAIETFNGRYTLYSRLHLI